VKTEVAKLSNANGRATEDKRVVLEISGYDIKGAKTENQYFPVNGPGATLTGQETYKYDEKGNISEMTLLKNGSLVSREVYKYEYDFVGNWTKMTTSVAVVEGGKLTFEPSEVTYRSIMYYLDENMTKLMQPASPPADSATTSPTNTAATTDTKSIVSSPSKSQPTGDGAATSSTAKATATDTKPIVSSPSKSQSTGDSTKPAERKESVALKSAPSVPAPKAAGERSTDSAALIKSGSSASDSKRTVSLGAEPPPSAKESQPSAKESSASSTEPPATPKPRPLLKPISGGVLNANAISLPSPSYPDVARRMRTTGTVVVEVVIDENGKVISATATSGPLTLREAAAQAALRAKFSPTKLSGQPVKVSGVINYNFTLSQ
jgi:TonB family protein